MVIRDGRGIVYASNASDADLLVSDASAKLHLLDGNDLGDKNVTITLNENGKALGHNVQVTDMELINGYLWVLSGGPETDDEIDEELLIVNATTGNVLHRASLSSLAVRKCTPIGSCLCTTRPRASAIAYDAENDEVWITGSYWPRMVSIDLLDEGKQQ